MRDVVRTLALLSLLLALAACAGGRRGPATPQERTSVRVENRGFLDVNVYVLRSTQRIRLGTVNGLSTRVLTIPSNLVAAATSLRFLADPIGGSGTPISQEITVQPGDQVTLTIGP